MQYSRAEMAWRKQRRRGRMSIWAFLCIACGLIFLFGNVLLLHDGFVELYESTFRGESDEPVSEKGKSWAYGSKVDRTLHNHMIELPKSALAMETHLRKLMQEKSTNIKVVEAVVSKYNSAEQSDSRRHDSQHANSDTIHIAPSDLRRTLSQSSDCAMVSNITDREFIASGWTKAVYKGVLHTNHPRTTVGKKVAVKTIDSSGHDVNNCMSDLKLDNHECYNRAAHKMLKEIVLLQGLQHPNVVQVLSHCVPLEEHRGMKHTLVSMVTELGDTIDLIHLLQMSWEDRLRVSYGLTKLIYYLATSPYGSVVLNDFRRQQFILVNGEIKLTDVDDMGFQEQPCQSDSDCQQYFSAANFTLKTLCIDNECHGMNEKKNIFNAARHFTTFLLPHGAPPALLPLISSLTNDYGNATSRSWELLQRLTRVVELYMTGAYLERSPEDMITTYNKYDTSDMPGQFDYTCRYNPGGVGCTLSVFDRKEAEDLCDRDSECQAFVLSSEKTWTGRHLAHFKNGIGNISLNKDTTLFMKPN